MKISTAALFLFACTMWQCGNEKLNPESLKGSEGEILINQVGYTPSATKMALIRNDSEKFMVINVENGKTVFKGMTGKPEYWSFSGDTVRTADFSSLTTPGRYRILTVGDPASSYQFTIGENVYNDVNKLSLKSFYLNRSGYQITEEFGGKWARPAGHPDTVVLIHKSAASKQRPEGTVISSPGGWYDAGDYNKYIVNSSISVYTMLLFYQLHPEYCDTLALDIPEKDNDLPDVIDEILYNLKWMLTMQDPNDGGVYHKLTSKVFDGFEMPDRDLSKRYVVMKSTQATLDFAATMAMAYRVFANEPHEQLKELSETCLIAARKAMEWAEANSDNIYKQPADIQTGEYKSIDIRDEWFWAKTELALSDNNPAMTDAAAFTQEPVIMSWGEVEMLGNISMALTENEAFAEAKKNAAETITAFADEMLNKYYSSAYRVSIDTFAWGSNSDVANEAIIKLLALRFTGDNKYKAAIQGDADYLMGRNATGYCFITGAGSKPPMNIHHRPSGSDGVDEPVPGFLVGGPNTVVMNDCVPLVKRSELPAKSYTDSECSYSTNEICINWNAPLFFVLGAMDILGD